MDETSNDYGENSHPTLYAMTFFPPEIKLGLETEILWSIQGYEPY